jgi:hypothetical protein
LDRYTAEILFDYADAPNKISLLAALPRKQGCLHTLEVEPMTQSSIGSTPDQMVAAKIVERFVDTGLLPANQAKKLEVQLAEGRLREEEWRLIAENAIAKSIRSHSDEH